MGRRRACDRTPKNESGSLEAPWEKFPFRSTGGRLGSDSQMQRVKCTPSGLSKIALRVLGRQEQLGGQAGPQWGLGPSLGILQDNQRS